MRDSKKNKFRITGIIAVILVLAITFTACGSNSSVKSSVKKLVQATYTADKNLFVEILSDESEEFMAALFGCSVAEANDLLIEDINESLESIDNYCGDSWKYEYHIDRISDVSEKDFEQLQEVYTEISGSTVEEAKTVSVYIKIQSKDEEFGETKNWTFVKIGNQWYWDVISTYASALLS